MRSVIVHTAYSTVYACLDPDLRVEVAVKRFDFKDRKQGKRVAAEGATDGAPDGIYGEAYWRERFVREARALARIDHPHIVSVKEMGADAGGMPYFVMPLIAANLVYEIGREARDAAAVARLPAELRPRRLAPARAAVLLRQLLSALAALHARGLVHRDVTPANILLTRRRGGAVKLADFGMVKYPDWSESREGAWIGTLDYIAPEQRENASGVDARADVYAAGAVAYRMLSGRLPAGRFPTLTELGLGLPPALDALLMSALAPRRQARPADASQFLARLEEALAAPVPAQVSRLVSITRNPV